MMYALEWLTVFIVGLLWIEHYMRWKFNIAKLKNSNGSETE